MWLGKASTRNWGGGWGSTRSTVGASRAPLQGGVPPAVCLTAPSRKFLLSKPSPENVLFSITSAPPALFHALHPGDLTQGPLQLPLVPPRGPRPAGGHLGGHDLLPSLVIFCCRVAALTSSSPYPPPSSPPILPSLSPLLLPGPACTPRAENFRQKKWQDHLCLPPQIWRWWQVGSFVLSFQNSSSKHTFEEVYTVQGLVLSIGVQWRSGREKPCLPWQSSLASQGQETLGKESLRHPKIMGLLWSAHTTEENVAKCL